jgi:hypothetical protein
VDLRAGLDDVERRKFLTLPGLELRPLGRPARSQSLCRLTLSRLPVIVKTILVSKNTVSIVKIKQCNLGRRTEG